MSKRIRTEDVENDKNWTIEGLLTRSPGQLINGEKLKTVRLREDKYPPQIFHTEDEAATWYYEMDTKHPRQVDDNISNSPPNNSTPGYNNAIAIVKPTYQPSQPFPWAKVIAIGSISAITIYGIYRNPTATRNILKQTHQLVNKYGSYFFNGARHAINGATQITNKLTTQTPISAMQAPWTSKRW